MWRALCVALGVLAYAAGCGRHEGQGTVNGARVPERLTQARAARQARARQELAAGAPRSDGDTQILFGDLHVHTTFSGDAFLRSLPALAGEGARVPADACDFARFCADLDFWAITDHAETLSPAHWLETQDAIRQCNAAAGDPLRPDVVAFLGWEWSQVGGTPADHYGYRSVIFRATGSVPSRPIGAHPDLGGLRQPTTWWERGRPVLFDFLGRQRYLDFNRYRAELRQHLLCPPGRDLRALPADCQELARTPEELLRKLDQWDLDSLVVVHGGGSALHAAPGAVFDTQLTGAQHDPKRQVLFELYSGHGTAEAYRDWRPVATDAAGRPMCPAPTTDYVPCCWQAGEIARARCGAVAPEECARRVDAARTGYLTAAGDNGHLDKVGPEEWMDCGQCRDCVQPAYQYRPALSAQYALALQGFADPDHPQRFRFGLIGASGTHSGRPGAGYKETARRVVTDVAAARDEKWRARLATSAAGGPAVVPFELSLDGASAPPAVDGDRAASFLTPGGLVAVHASGRDRDAVWAALQRRQVYATSGERILLWFELVNAPAGAVPMGGEAGMTSTPRFEVRAIGALQQRPGCPSETAAALGAERLQHLCGAECYHPTDERRLISRIEIVRIRPRQRPDEPIAALIDDPWRSVACPADPAGCVVEVEDPDFVAAGRAAVYYARAVQEATPAINGGGLRCRFDADGRCLEINPCYADGRTPADDDCLAPLEERAWSSPIYLENGS